MRTTAGRLMLALSILVTINVPASAQRRFHPRNRVSSAARDVVPEASAASANLPSLSSFYRFVPFGFPGAALSLPLGINDRGDISGTYYDFNGVGHCFIFSGGTFTTHDNPAALIAPGAGSSCGGINNRGDVAGVYYDSSGFQHGFIRALPAGCAAENNSNCKPAFTDFTVPGESKTTDPDFEFGPGLGTAAVGINDFDAAVGMYATHIGQGTQTVYYSDGFIRAANGTFTSVDAPHASHTEADGTKFFSINDFGAIAGDYETGPVETQITHGFVLFNGKYTPIDVPGSEKGGFGTQANGINSLGFVLGVFSDSSGAGHGLVWAAGNYYALDYPGKPFTEVHSMNNLGVVVGAYATDPEGGTLFGFVAYPLPAPAPPAPVR